MKTATTTAKSSSQAPVAKESSSSSTTQTTNEDSNTVISQFASAAKLYGQSDLSFMITAQSGSDYTIEVRQNNAASDSANLVGIYQYNATSGAVSKTF